MKGFASALLVTVPLAGIAALVGCAEGAEVDPAESFLASAPVDAGNAQDEDEDDSVKIPPPSNPPDEEDEDETDDPDAGPGGNDAGSDGGTKPDGGSTGSCASPNTCASAVNLGQVSGDKGADTQTRQGHTSQWLTVRVTENDSDIGGVQLEMTATLTSPPGTNYDLYVYVPSSDTLECSAVSYQSTSSSTSDSVKAKFGESGLLSNGSSDDRTVTVEVRHVSGTCDPSKQWTLTIEGNK